MNELRSVEDFREHLVATLVELGRSAEGAWRQVSDFEAAIRRDMPPPNTGPQQRRRQQQMKGYKK